MEKGKIAVTGTAASDLLRFQIERKIISLGKNFLEIIEDLISDGYIIPVEKHQRLRKKILDGTNDGIRDLNLVIDKLDINLK